MSVTLCFVCVLRLVRRLRCSQAVRLTRQRSCGRPNACSLCARTLDTHAPSMYVCFEINMNESVPPWNLVGVATIVMATSTVPHGSRGVSCYRPCRKLLRPRWYRPVVRGKGRLASTSSDISVMCQNRERHFDWPRDVVAWSSVSPHHSTRSNCCTEIKRATVSTQRVKKNKQNIL